MFEKIARGNTQRRLLYSAFAVLVLFASLAPAREVNQKKDKANGTPVIWEDRSDITNRDLFYGRGSQERVPKEPYTFIKEDMNGSNPKFDVTDANGIKWKVKLGDEAQPETTVS